jgi:hypothetical protein
MEAKEKAKQLVEKMLNEQSYTEDLYDAKKCALICVDELINYSKEWDKDYWHAVKREIIKL